MHLRTTRTGWLSASLILAATVSTTAAQELDRARSAYAEWARIKSQTSEEKSEWQREQALLNDSLAAIRAESAALDERITELKNSSTESDKKRAELTAEIGVAKGAAETLAKKVAEAEGAVRELLPLLPAHLLAELQPRLQGLPENSADTKLALGARVLAIAAILGHIEKFNNTYSVVSEIRDLGQGRSVEVKTMYLGLAGAYFADAAGTTAGYGAPGAKGWEWKTADAELSARIATAIAIHENMKPPAFVSLPVEVR